MTLQQKREQAQANKDIGLRSLSVDAIRSVDGDETGRVFRLSFSSEEPYTRSYGVEILDHAEGAVDLSRLNSIGVLLFNHDADRVLGKIRRAWIENHKGYADVEFDDDEDSERVCKKVRSGTLKATSIPCCWSCRISVILYTQACSTSRHRPTPSDTSVTKTCLSAISCWRSATIPTEWRHNHCKIYALPTQGATC